SFAPREAAVATRIRSAGSACKRPGRVVALAAVAGVSAAVITPRLPNNACTKSSTGIESVSLPFWTSTPISQALIGEINSSFREAASSITAVRDLESRPSTAHRAAWVSSKIGFIGFPRGTSRRDQVTAVDDGSAQRTAKCLGVRYRQEPRYGPPVFGDDDFTAQPLNLVHDFETACLEFSRSDLPGTQHQQGRGLL